MPPVAPTVWNLRRKWLGNLIPVLFWLPLTVAGIAWMVLQGEIVGPGLWLLIAATVLGWLAVNFWGLYQNRKMRREVTRILGTHELDLSDAMFVGIATPRYSSMLDPHEDVGFLQLLSDRLLFSSETRSIEFRREQINKVRFRANVHTLLGLGRWISVEGVADGKPVRLLIEPRERPTLLGNLLQSKTIANRIKRWLK